MERAAASVTSQAESTGEAKEEKEEEQELPDLFTLKSDPDQRPFFDVITNWDMFVIARSIGGFAMVYVRGEFKRITLAEGGLIVERLYPLTATNSWIEEIKDTSYGPQLKMRDGAVYVLTPSVSIAFMDRLFHNDPTFGLRDKLTKTLETKKDFERGFFVHAFNFRRIQSGDFRYEYHPHMFGLSSSTLNEFDRGQSSLVQGVIALLKREAALEASPRPWATTLTKDELEFLADARKANGTGQWTIVRDGDHEVWFHQEVKVVTRVLKDTVMEEEPVVAGVAKTAGPWIEMKRVAS